MSHKGLIESVENTATRILYCPCNLVTAFELLLSMGRNFRLLLSPGGTQRFTSNILPISNGIQFSCITVVFKSDTLLQHLQPNLIIVSLIRVYFNSLMPVILDRIILKLKKTANVRIT